MAGKVSRNGDMHQVVLPAPRPVWGRQTWPSSMLPGTSNIYTHPPEVGFAEGQKNQDACSPILPRSCRWCMCSLVIYGTMWKTLVSVLPKHQGYMGQHGNLSKNQDFCWRALVMMVCI